MKKVYELLNKREPLAGDVGIEIEVEGKDLRAVDNKYWKSEADGSLRGHFPESAIEFVLKKPIPIGDVKDSVENLVKELKGATFNFSFRTSVHIHLNVQDLTEVQAMNLMYTYLLLEEPLVNFCGRERKGNRFCLRLVDAEGMVNYLNKIFEKGLKHAMRMNENDIRYSGLNIASLRKYGSIEFRSMRGNIDAQNITIWAHALYALREYAKKMENPKAIYDQFRNQEPKQFLDFVLGAGAAEYFTYPRMVREMQRSFSLSIDLPHSYKEPAQAADNHEDYMQALAEQWPGHVGVITDEKINKQGQLYVMMHDNWMSARKATAGDKERVKLYRPENYFFVEDEEPVPVRPRAQRAVVQEF